MTIAIIILATYLIAAAVYAWIPDTHRWKGLRRYREQRAAWQEAETYGRVYRASTDTPDTYPSHPPR